MSRDDGFIIADIDVGLLDDPKVRRLLRATQDENVLCRALIGYFATLLSSWGDGDRLTIEEAAPTWLTDVDDLHRRLVAVDLLDADGRVLDGSWEGWFTPAWDRREKRRQSGAKGGRTGGKGRPKRSLGGAQASSNPSGPSGPDRTVPTREILDRGQTSAREPTERADVAALLERWPKVSRAQRTTLDEIADRHGSDYAAVIIRALPGDHVDPLAVVLEADRQWQAEQRERVDREERAWAATKREEREAADRLAEKMAKASL